MIYCNKEYEVKDLPLEAKVKAYMVINSSYCDNQTEHINTYMGTVSEDLVRSSMLTKLRRISDKYGKDISRW